MKAIKKETNEKGNIILTCETSVLFGLIKKEVQFIATEEFPGVTLTKYYKMNKISNNLNK